MIPPRHVLAAVDFSDASRVALGFAARLARHCGASLHVLHVQDPLLHTAARATGIDLAAETRTELEQFMQSAYAAAGPPPRYHVLVGKPVDVVCDLANREEVDVIVTGTSGMSGPSHAIFGSTTEGVLVRSDISILVVPPSWTAPRGDTPDLSGTGPVTVGFERTAPALAAARAARRLAGVLKTTVDALHVVPPIRVLERWQPHAETAVAERMEASRRELSGVLKTMPDGAAVRLLVKSGDVATAFAETIAQGGGAHGLAVVGRRSPGSRSGPPGALAAKIMDRCPAPVLVYLPSD